VELEVAKGIERKCPVEVTTAGMNGCGDDGEGGHTNVGVSLSVAVVLLG